MKKLSSLILCLVIALSLSACLKGEEKEVNNEAAPLVEEEDVITTTLLLDGKETESVSYKINNEEYYTLYDAALLLKNTDLKFDVSCSDDSKIWYITTGCDYTSGKASAKKAVKNPTASSAEIAVFKDGEPIFIKAFIIDEEYFFNIFDIARALGFSAQYSENGKSLEIKTAEPFKAAELSLNPFFLSLVGRTKAEIDTLLGGASGYYKDLGMVIYGENRVMYGFNTLGSAFKAEDVPAENRADTAHILVKDVINNCPSSVTFNDIKKVFPNATSSYSEMDECTVITAKYNGVDVSFFMEGSQEVPTDVVFVKAPSGYSYTPSTEYIVIENSK